MTKAINENTPLVGTVITSIKTSKNNPLENRYSLFK